HPREANRARSKADFKNKIAICESEASETQYNNGMGDVFYLGSEPIKG
ncbi:unnamed protein product, partial [marine sediment metagenome]